MAVDHPTKFCQTCGEQIHAEAVICPECGVEQPGQRAGRGDTFGFVHAYPLWAWLAGIVLAFVALGWGLVALGYFAIKGSGSDFEGQTTAEILTVLALALIGVLIVEWGGAAGTRRFWRAVAWLLGGLIALGVALSVLAAVVGVLV